MQIQQYIRILRESWWIIIAILLVTTGIALAYSYSQTPIYETTATFVVNPGVRIAQTDDVLYSIDTLAGRSSLATTYANILQSRIIVETARQSLELPPAMLQDYKITAVVLPDSSVLMLRVQGTSPVLAADLANAIGESGLQYIGNLQEIYELHQLDLATVEPDPISPNHGVDITLGILAGLMGGVAFTILRQFLLNAYSDEQPYPALPGATSKIDFDDTKFVVDINSVSMTSPQTRLGILLGLMAGVAFTVLRIVLSNPSDD